MARYDADTAVLKESLNEMGVAATVDQLQAATKAVQETKDKQEFYEKKATMKLADDFDDRILAMASSKPTIGVKRPVSPKQEKMEVKR